jgi:hypothetical protein
MEEKVYTASIMVIVRKVCVADTIVMVEVSIYPVLWPWRKGSK